MSGALSHSPALIIRKLLVDLGQATEPSDSKSWPAYAGQEPDTPDEAITVYATEGRLFGRHMTDGEVQEQYGVQVRIRSQEENTGYAKANDIAIALDQAVYLDTVTIGTKQYLVWALHRAGCVHRLGKAPNTQRSIHTINAYATIRQTA